MCKIFLVAGIKTEHVPKVARLAKSMAKAMSNVEDDGVGYAAITKGGQIYGEKWLNKDQAFVIHDQPVIDPIVTKIKNMFGETIDWVKPPVTESSYESFGIKNVDDTVALILHARKATSGEKVLKNTHPFVEIGDNDTPVTALIHNGSIVNHDKLTKKYSTCDSETLLHEYIGNQMYHNPWGINQLASTVIGTYAVGVLSSQLIDEVWTPYLDIFKSNKDLVGAYVPEIETMVFATTEYVLETALKDADMTFKNMIKIKDGYLHRLNAITGERMEDPISFTTSAQYAHGYGYNRGYSNSTYPYGPIDNTVKSARPKFERNHPSLFITPYLDAGMSDDEKSLFEENKHLNHKALRLVTAALSGLA